ncbi:Ran GTPase-binding protein MOG1 [Aspergillus saccharolyticus JOP 1030-1]|uniref:Mog1p/PsbP-like protein n=1 Tax=Aspergillus saccharolyticus JOP 1030-1 TaxID=1450539 RepID=A0A318ZIY6_9EURO|nr:Mog1p/PsbP-like protein [Aspergillus saccharolyticus JOP 1030-1]PYH46825.1 Mog1p/PsbP-like protein [Aspergillus saccharolyticus JOP 1030-1]
MPTFTEQPLYGGAIQGIVPQGWIDASTLREIPDHQELYLSPTTLSSLIIEVNQFVPNTTAQLTLNSHPSLLPAASQSLPDPDQETLNHAATIHHLLDICDPADTLTITSAPRRVSLAKFPGQVAGYIGTATFTSKVEDARGRGKEGQGLQQRVAGGAGDTAAGAAAAGSSGDGALTTTTLCWFLLVRLVEQETDLLVLVNVPQKEFEERGDVEGLRQEEAIGEGVVEELVKRLEVKEWELFA